MNKVLIVKNVSREGPGLISSVLEQEIVPFDIIDLENNDSFPSLSDYAALVILGGPDSANDKSEKITQELSQITTILNKHIPCLGICLGLQLLVKAAGGSVVKAEESEVGFFDRQGDSYMVELTEAGRNDTLFYDLPDSMPVFQLHGETVELTKDMRLLATSRGCNNQIIRITDTAYGIQSHFELTPEMLELWAEQDPDLVSIGKEELVLQFERIWPSYKQTGEILLRNYLRIAGI